MGIRLLHVWIAMKKFSLSVRSQKWRTNYNILIYSDYYGKIITVFIGIQEKQWKVHVSKSCAKNRNVCRSYGYPKHIIEKQQLNNYNNNLVNENNFHTNGNRISMQILYLKQLSNVWKRVKIDYDKNLIVDDKC